MFEEVGTQCCHQVSLCRLGWYANPGYRDEGELRGPWQGLGWISLLQTKMAPSFLLDNIVEIPTATGVTDGQTGFSVWLDWTSGCFTSWVGTLSPNDTHVIVLIWVSAGSTSLSNRCLY